MGHALNKMLAVFIPERHRHPRLFRAKYTEELNLGTLEDCLISAANKVFDLSTGDHSLKPARPSAKAFLDILARVQAVVSDVMETAATTHTVRSRQAKNSRRPPGHRSRFCQTSFFQPAVSPSEELGGLSSRPSASPPTEDAAPVAVTSPGSPLVEQHIQSDITVEPTDSPLHLPEELTGTPSHSPSSACQSLSSSPSSNTSFCLDRLPPDFTDLLTELDQTMATFEFALVSTVSRRLRTLTEVADVHEVAVLFSETIMWALAVGLLDAGKLSDRDPMVLVSLPRLAIFVGCLLLPDSPIGPRHLTSGSPAPFMFADSVKELAYLSRQLTVLRADQLWRLACWLSPFGLSERETTSVTAAAAARASTRHNGRASKFASGASKPLHPNARADPTADTDNGYASGRVKTQNTNGGGGGVRPIMWNTLGLHAIYKCISSVAGLFSTNYPTEYRDILQVVSRLDYPFMIVKGFCSSLLSCLAIEMNDSEEDGKSSVDNPDSCTPPTTPVRLQPLSPIALIESSTDNVGSPDSSVSLLDEPEARLGFIKGIDLRQLFDWNEVLFSPNRPCCRLLFEPSGQLQQTHSSSLPTLSEKLPAREVTRPSLTYSATAVNKLSLEALFPPHIEEVGLDVAAFLLEDGSVDSATRNSPGEGEKGNSLTSSVSPKSLELALTVTGLLYTSHSFTIIVSICAPFTKGPSQAASSTTAAPSARHHPLWSLLISSPVEGEAGETPNPAYPLPPWQPDTPARQRSISNTWVMAEVPAAPTTVSSNEDSDEGEDSETDQSRRSGGLTRWATAPVIGKECASCKATFTLIRRRHHCRRCGHIFCGSCCCHWVPVESLGSLAPVRVCKECAEFVQAGLAEVLMNASSPAEQRSLLCQ
ncbi:unnamed protein product [Schistocephalus solidus]|uniref:FYVE-type domain-containing protein n=1 Tax=Schistocephalus solidus TaxID=70667 RepID=A0A3P7DWX1_SCHSO|nr:unnamed protein product [Schistocephalus solidus]